MRNEQKGGKPADTEFRKQAERIYDHIAGNGTGRRRRKINPDLEGQQRIGALVQAIRAEGPSTGEILVIKPKKILE